MAMGGSRWRGLVSPLFWFVALVVAVDILLLALPVLVVMITSLGGNEFVAFPPRSWSLRWFGRIPPHYYRAFATSLVLALAATAVSVAVGVPAALGVVRGRLRGAVWLDAFYRSPLHIPGLVLGVSFLQFYVYLYQVLRLPLRGTFLGLLLAHVIVTVPYIFAAAVSVLQRFQMELEEAAHGLGATPVQTLFRVTLPVIRPAIFAGAFFSFVNSFDNVPVSLFLVSSGTTTLPIEIFTSVDQSMTPVVFAVSTLTILFSTAMTLLFEVFVGIRSATVSDQR